MSLIVAHTELFQEVWQIVEGKQFQVAHEVRQAVEVEQLQVGEFLQLLTVNFLSAQLLILLEEQKTRIEGDLLVEEDCQIVVDSCGASDKGVAWSYGRFGCRHGIWQF